MGSSSPIEPGRRRRRRWPKVAVALIALAGLAVGWYAVHQRMPAWYARLWFPLEHEDLILRESGRNDLDPALVAAMIYEESGFVADSVSSQGAIGLMQVQPATATFVTTLRPRPSPAPSRLAEPAVNIAYGTRLLRFLLDRYGDRGLALAAYNAGAANVDRWRAEAREAGRTLRVPDDIPFSETRAYVRHVGRTRDIYLRTYRDRLTP